RIVLDDECEVGPRVADAIARELRGEQLRRLDELGRLVAQHLANERASRSDGLGAAAEVAGALHGWIRRISESPVISIRRRTIGEGLRRLTLSSAETARTITDI